MSKRKWDSRLMAFALFCATFLSFSVLGANRANACSCLEPTIEASYNNSDNVIAARPLLRLGSGSQVWYLARVRENYKGCIDQGDWVILTTARSSAACGLELDVGTSYLINGNANGNFLGIPKLSFGLCDYNVELAGLTEHDQEFLDGRYVCCGDDCECADGSDPVQCLVNPCDVAPACPDGECVANYCGGCNAEFYDESGYAVCQEQGECASDDDCPAGQWCREAAPPEGEEVDAPVYECVDFAPEGATCNGFTLPWYYERCEPGLSCDTPDYVADAPGVCRAACASDADCAAEQYCASDGLCDDDGLCEREVDCNLEGNVYAHIECVGHGVCDIYAGTCGWECEDPMCVDLAGFDFGPCDAVLGWGVQDGECTQLSGCSSEPFTLFASEAECEVCESAPGCQTDADCVVTGCSSHVCASEPVETTCEWRPEYACYQDPAITSCGCTAGACGWAQTDELSACLSNPGGN